MLGSFLWSEFIWEKFLKNISVIEWIRKEKKKRFPISNIWSGMLETLSYLNRCLAWKMGKGFQMRLGVDPFIGWNDVYKLLESTI